MRSDPAPTTDPFTLTPARVHEAEGRDRRAFAVFQAARHPGPLFWLLPAHAPQMPMPQGLPQGVADRLCLLRPRHEADLLWAAEEALRVTLRALVIAEPDRPLSLTAGRRLQLAAKAGGATGLILIREGAGSNAAETRWSCDMCPAQAADSTPHRWSRIKNKKGTIGTWTLDWDGAKATFHMVSPAGERREPADAPS